ncbi:Ubiquitin-conjugating enzyme E2 T [Mortierella claussenii]|nr:Ubiquitin-conjugating enzyme E2 T [Mortierella claussenii]
MSATVEKRILIRMRKELKDLETSPPEGIICYPLDDNIVHLQAELAGPKDTPYAGGIFKLDIHIPERYPFEPPRCQFLTKIYHPNIDDEGRICLDILKSPPKGKWGPAISIPTLLTSLVVLLGDPNPDDPLIADIQYVGFHIRAMGQQDSLSASLSSSSPPHSPKRLSGQSRTPFSITPLLAPESTAANTATSCITTVPSAEKKALPRPILKKPSLKTSKRTEIIPELTNGQVRSGNFSETPKLETLTSGVMPQDSCCGMVANPIPPSRRSMSPEGVRYPSLQDTIPVFSTSITSENGNVKDKMSKDNNQKRMLEQRLTETISYETVANSLLQTAQTKRLKTIAKGHRNKKPDPMPISNEKRRQDAKVQLRTEKLASGFIACILPIIPPISSKHRAASALEREGLSKVAVLGSSQQVSSSSLEHLTHPRASQGRRSVVLSTLAESCIFSSQNTVVVGAPGVDESREIDKKNGDDVHVDKGKGKAVQRREADENDEGAARGFGESTATTSRQVSASIPVKVPLTIAHKRNLLKKRLTT